MHIHNKLARQQTHVTEDQVQLFSTLAMELIEVRRDLDLDAFCSSAEYKRFLRAGYACGLVCSNFAPMDVDLFSRANNRPHEYLANCSFHTLRHWLHHLFRAEKWVGDYSSPILDAIDSCALLLVADRLACDERLREPAYEIIDESATRLG